jgi:transcription initiation factor IIE alpha subunit
MQDQLDLFPDASVPYQTHSATSHAAAREIKPKAATRRQKVYAYLADRGAAGATDEEIQIALEMNPSTQRPRRIELIRLGRVIDSGERRETTSGRKATVWRAR